ncbi:hypothetical protein R3P38DRAFT_3243727 [Favolaschia claudopus]|uniref:Uncharacterized protein n=1 Tax=Favolaschia claudopus TaxID=2862362 RepID=A0AAV9Z380_9AGAR
MGRNKDGIPLDKKKSRALAAHLRMALNLVGNKQRAPFQWTDADLEVVKYRIPDLRLCRHNWKLNAIMTLVYPSWKRNWVQSGGHVLKGEGRESQSSGKGKKRKRDLKAEDSSVPTPDVDSATPTAGSAISNPSSTVSSSTSTPGQAGAETCIQKRKSVWFWPSSAVSHSSIKLKLDSLAALATTAAPATAAATQIPENAQNSQGAGGSSSATPSGASNKEKAAKRTKNPDALLKANQANSARSLRCSLLVAV